jgi:hypothetical protein
MNRFACLSLVPLTAAPTVSAAALNPAMDDEKTLDAKGAAVGNRVVRVIECARF